MINEHDIRDMWPGLPRDASMLSEEMKKTTASIKKELDVKDMWPHPYFGPSVYEIWKMNKEQQEKDPNGKSPKQPGAKLDAGKSPVWQGLLDYFPMACKAVADVSEGGAAKYAWKGWQHVPDGISRYRNAQGRHILDESIEGAFDPDGFRHLAQNAWNALAALELTLRNEKEKK